MRVVVLGASGMLGHTLVQVLEEAAIGDVTAVVSGDPAQYTAVVGPVNVLTAEPLKAVSDAEPDVVVNCIEASPTASRETAITLNSLFPHRLAQTCAAQGSRLIQISTDRVFSGQRGGYTEIDTPDPAGLYGRTKLLGEVGRDEGNCLTIRAAPVGHEIGTPHGLLDRFLAQTGKTVPGYTQAVTTPLTTAALAKTLVRILRVRPTLAGLMHLAATPISHYDLLTLIQDAFDVNIEVVPDPTVVIDRSLDATRFWTRTQNFLDPIMVPQMIRSLAEEPYAHR